MSATFAYEPYRLPAGFLALAVHGAFFALLYFGFTWQIQTAETMSVELWRSLPEVEVAPPPPPVIAQAVQPAQPVQPEKLAKPDIALPDKKKVETKPVVTKPDKKQAKTQPVSPDLEEQKQAEADQRERLAAQQAAQAARERAEQAAQERAEQAARDKAAQDAAMDAVVNEYKAKIMAKIRRNIVEPPDVAKKASAEFRVTLLPDGSVLPPELIKSSGNTTYDEAVERAILKSKPLPLPPDVTMFQRFRVLRLVFRPAE